MDERNTRYCSWSCRYPAAHDRFWQSVDKQSDAECWPWIGFIGAGGYGTMPTPHGPVKAHRYSYEIANGKIPQGDGWHGNCVLHRCDTPSCVNPAHLFLGTHADNMQDMKRKGRQPSRRGYNNGRRKLTADDVLAIRSSTDTQAVLAARYGVIQAQISRIQRRVAWSHL